MFYTRCGATSGRQRTAVPVAYSIECSVMMKLKLTDEVEVCQFTLLLVLFCAGCVHPLCCGESTLFGGIVSFTLSGGVVNTGHVSVSARVSVNGTRTRREYVVAHVSRAASGGPPTIFSRAPLIVWNVHIVAISHSGRRVALRPSSVSCPRDACCKRVARRCEALRGVARRRSFAKRGAGPAGKRRKERPACPALCSLFDKLSKVVISCHKRGGAMDVIRKCDVLAMNLGLVCFGASESRK